MHNTPFLLTRFYKRCATLRIALFGLLLGMGLLGSQITFADDSETLGEIETNTSNTANNTASSSSTLTEIYNLLDNFLYGTVPKLGNQMAIFTAVKPAEAASSQEINTTLNNVSPAVLGQTTGTTQSANYNYFLNNALLSNGPTTFPTQYLSANNLFTGAYYLTEEESNNLSNFLPILAGLPINQLRMPDPSWEPISTNFSYNANVTAYNSTYSTLTAVYNMNLNNLFYVASNGQPIELNGEIEGYNDSKISPNGLVDLIRDQTISSAEWWQKLSTLSFTSAIKEGVILMGGCFIELIRIDNTLQRILTAQSGLITLNLLSTNELASKQINNITNAS